MTTYAATLLLLQFDASAALKFAALSSLHINNFLITSSLIFAIQLALLFCLQSLIACFQWQCGRLQQGCHPKMLALVMSALMRDLQEEEGWPDEADQQKEEADFNAEAEEEEEEETDAHVKVKEEEREDTQSCDETEEEEEEEQESCDEAEGEDEDSEEEEDEATMFNKQVLGHALCLCALQASLCCDAALL